MNIERPTRFICNTPVWGKTYTQLFLEVALPSLLAKGNLPALKTSAVFQIYTTPKDAECIRMSDVYRELLALIPVEFHYIKESLDEPIPYQAMSHCHRLAIEAADKENAALIFLHPDCIMAEGSLAHAENCILEGKRVVAITGIRLALEKVIPLLAPHYNSQGRLRIMPKELVKLAINNLHPITAKQMWENRQHIGIVPYNLFWKVGEEGLLGRCFSLHPLMVFPRKKHMHFDHTIDQDYVKNACPDFNEHHIVADSEKIFMCELTPESRNVYGYVNCSVDNLVQFALHSTNELLQFHTKTPIRLHCGYQTESLWKEAEAKAESLMKQVFDKLKLFAKT